MGRDDARRRGAGGGGKNRSRLNLLRQGGGTLACKLAEYGFSVVAFDAGPYWRPLEDFASDERQQTKLYWTDERIVDGENPLQLGANNSGKSVGGSTVHFAMVSLRFRPEWFKSRTALGYGADWPLDWREMWGYYREVEEALSISGPVNYPWGPEAAALSLPPARTQCAGAGPGRRLRGAGDRLDADAARDVSAPRGLSPPCVYRGMCVIGCSTNAKQSVLVTWLPRALAAGAEIRDLAMVGRVEHDAAGRATGVHYHREGRWRFQRATQRRRRRLCNRDAAAAAEFGERALPRRAGQSIRASSAKT